MYTDNLRLTEPNIAGLPSNKKVSTSFLISSEVNPCSASSLAVNKMSRKSKWRDFGLDPSSFCQCIGRDLTIRIASDYSMFTFYVTGIQHNIVTLHWTKRTNDREDINFCCQWNWIYLLNLFENANRYSTLTRDVHQNLVIVAFISGQITDIFRPGRRDSVRCICSARSQSRGQTGREWVQVSDS